MPVILALVSGQGPDALFLALRLLARHIYRNTGDPRRPQDARNTGREMADE
jgi:hypothetical protein